jgi:glutamine amidotransferase
MIAIIDYEAGNTRSVINALNRLQVDYILTKEKDKIAAADRIILPGVGHAGAAMRRLVENDLVDVIRSYKKPFLGICVGMQLMYEHCEEGNVISLGLIPGSIKKFKQTKEIKIPHMGWNNNKIISTCEDNLLSEVSDKETYFVHSYRADVNAYTIASCTYFEDFTSYVKKDNFHGLQFHPEKSGSIGQEILSKFIII